MQQPVVWLVEDETSIADTLIYMLQQEGFAVKAFERGLPVLEAAAAGSSARHSGRRAAGHQRL